MPYKVLLADADGTLFDFHAGEKAAISETFRFFNIPVTEETTAVYHRVNDAQWKKLERGETTPKRLRVDRFTEFLAQMQLSGDPVAMSEHFMGQLGQQRILIPGAENFCRKVSMHMPIYLVTNGIARVQRSRFADCNLTPYVTGMVISEEVGAAKPDPAMLFEALKQAKVKPEDALLMGDSITADIAAANNAGIRSILFTCGASAPEEHGATHVAHTYEQALKIILS